MKRRGMPGRLHGLLQAGRRQGSAAADLGIKSPEWTRQQYLLVCRSASSVGRTLGLADEYWEVKSFCRASYCHSLCYVAAEARTVSSCASAPWGKVQAIASAWAWVCSGWGLAGDRVQHCARDCLSAVRHTEIDVGFRQGGQHAQHAGTWVPRAWCGVCSTEVLRLEMNSLRFSKPSQLLIAMFWKVPFNTKKHPPHTQKTTDRQLRCYSCRALPSFIIIDFSEVLYPGSQIPASLAMTILLLQNSPQSFVFICCASTSCSVCFMTVKISRMF